jgi:hypothetical protein
MAEPGTSDDDVRHDDLEFNPQLEPKSSKAWLNLLRESEKAFEDWNKRGDNIDERYASLKRLSAVARDKEFQLFWANIEVLKPSIYAKAPIPVVVPKFKDQRKVPQAASEFLERCCIVAFDLARINELMLLVRDDVVLYGRGVPWVRYEDAKKGDKRKRLYDYEKVCVDHKHRRDFLHSLSRSWREVWWVAGASYLTRDEARDRFKKYSGFAYQEAEYKVDRDSEEIGGTDKRERAKFWEIWDKKNERVVWVAEGCEDILDEDDPHLELEGFFPCPQPAYGTVQPGSLIPVPDVLQYADQLDEVSLLTGRIHALSDALEVKGFYPAGGGELADAIQTAINIKTPGRVLVPISNWAAFGGSKDVIIWMPIDMIAATITQLVTLRKEVIDDVYQITGLSDIMRGSTDARETLGAQQLKTQFGSTRIRDKQQALVRLARDIVVISSEIITEEFDPVTMIEMSQTQLPTMDMQRQQLMQLQQEMQAQEAQIAQLKQSPQFGQVQQQNPQGIQTLEQEVQRTQQSAQAAMKKITEAPTIEQVLTFLKNNKAKAFTLDIETDSTILIDEQGEKERRAEFINVLTPMLQQIGQMVTATPESAEFCGALLKFAIAPYRAGRELDGAVDNLVELMKQQADKPKGDDPETAKNKLMLQIEQMKDATVKENNEKQLAMKQNEMVMRDNHEKMKIASSEKIKLAELASRRGDAEQKAQQAQLDMVHSSQEHQATMVELAAKREADAQKFSMEQARNQSKMAHDAQRASDQRAAQQFKMMQPPAGPRRA